MSKDFEQQVKEYYRKYTGQELQELNLADNDTIDFDEKRSDYRAASVAIAHAEGIDKVKGFYGSLTGVIDETSKELLGRDAILGSQGDDIGDSIYNLVNNKQIISKTAKPINNYVEELDYLNRKNSGDLNISDIGSGETLLRSALRESTTIQQGLSPVSTTKKALSTLNEKLGFNEASVDLAYIHEEGYDGFQWAKDNGYEDYVQDFESTINSRQAQQLADYIDFQRINLKAAQQNPIAGFTGATLSLVTDPTNMIALIPKLQSVTKTVAASIGLTTALTAVQEASLRGADPTRSISESVATTVAAGMLGGSLSYATRSRIYTPENLTKMKDKQTERLNNMFSGKAPQDLLKEGKKKGYTGTDTEIAEQAHMDWNNKIVEDIENYDALQKLDEEYSKQESTGPIGDFINKISGKVSPAGRLKQGSTKAVRNAIDLMTTSTTKTKANAANLRSESSIRAELEIAEGRLTPLQDAHEAVHRDLVKKGQLETDEFHTLLRSRIKTGRSSGIDQIDSLGDRYRHYYDQESNSLQEQGIFTASQEHEIKTGSKYSFDLIDNDLKFTNRNQVLENIKRQQEEVRSTLDLDTLESRVDLALEEAINGNQKAFFEIKELKRISLRLHDDEILNNIKKALKDKELKEFKQSIGREGKTLKDIVINDGIKVFTSNPKIMKLYKQSVKDVSKKEVNSFLKTKPEKLYDMKMDSHEAAFKKRTSSEKPSSAHEGVLQREKYIFDDDVFAPVYVKDVHMAAKAYNRSSSLSRAFKNAFGETNPAKVFQKVMKDAAKEVKARQEGLTLKEKQKLDIAAKKDENDLRDVLDMLTDQFGRPDNYNSVFNTSLRNLKNMQIFNLGSSSIAQIPEIAMAVSHKMASKQLKHVEGFANNIKKLDLSLSSQQSIGIGLQKANSKIALHRSGIAESTLDTSTSKLENYLERGSHYMFSSIGMNYATDATHSIITHVAVGDVLDIAGKILKKTATKAELDKLSTMKLTPNKALSILKKAQKYGEVTPDGGLDPRFDKWKFSETRDLHFIITEIQKISAKPNKENLPGFISTPVGSFIFAFQSFIFAATAQQVAYRGQQMARNPMYHMAMMTAQLLGASSSMLIRDMTRGRDPTARFEKPELFALQMVTYSGIMGVFGDLGMAGINVFGEGHDDSLIRQTSPAYQMWGGGLAMSRIAKGLGSASEGDYNKALGVLGVGSYLYTAGLSRALASELGTKPD